MSLPFLPRSLVTTTVGCLEAEAEEETKGSEDSILTQRGEILLRGWLGEIGRAALPVYVLDFVPKKGERQPTVVLEESPSDCDPWAGEPFEYPPTIYPVLESEYGNTANSAQVVLTWAVAVQVKDEDCTLASMTTLAALTEGYLLENVSSSKVSVTSAARSPTNIERSMTEELSLQQHENRILQNHIPLRNQSILLAAEAEHAAERGGESGGGKACSEADNAAPASSDAALPSQPPDIA
nr:hypothetical protein Iba_chr01eCG3290 [Ipomoea batatas]